MADLTGSLPSDTYKQLLQVGSGNVGVTATLQDIQDGSGTNTALQLSTTTANVNGTFTINGFTYSINAATTVTGGGTISLGGFTASFTGNATLSGTNTGDQTITLTGDVTGSGTGSFATTYAGIVPMNKGGMNASITASAGGIFYSTGSAGALLSGTATANKVLMSGSSGAPSWSTPTFPSTAGTAGKVLVSDGTNIVSSTPTFPNASATSGKFIRSDGTNWIASTPTLPTTAGTSGKVLVSDGTNFVSSTPTFPNASATSGKIIQSDGTNWVASTPTFPSTAGSSGQILVSNGTNFTVASKGVGQWYVGFTAATATINSQLGVSSITRSSAGVYIVNFFASQSTTDPIIATCQGSGKTYAVVTARDAGSATITTYNDVGTVTEPTAVYVVGVGL